MSLLVSIIIPVYQVSDYIERCITSVLQQTYQEIECIVVDDASEDDSIEKCERLIKEYNDNLDFKPDVNGRIMFKILHHERKRGLSAARNTGTNSAKGDYIYYLDSDDEITSNCIEKLMSYVLEDDSLEMVQGNYLRTGGANDDVGRSINMCISSNEDARYYFLEKRTLNYAVWNKLLKRSFVVDNKIYNKEGIINEDLLWTFYLIKHLNRAHLCEDITYYYHKRQGSILLGTDAKVRGKSYAIIFDELLNNLTKDNEYAELKGFHTIFSYSLANYLRCTPQLNQVLWLYKQKARLYNCWSVYFTITSVALISHLCNPSCILRKLYSFRQTKNAHRQNLIGYS